ncbi:hypothetical protein Elgi_38340 [Paenibacillus elgii]|uniref:hypothetical protein n=1 Tax=Paenibacillus elgii TaxID=189691 RepID=UPI002D7DCDFC|nr:hypothetical protein Elgi_38340 [Paenibacillus elgii]
MAQVKCKICDIKDDKILMIKESNNKYYHIENCHYLYLKDKAFKQKELEEKNELTDSIVRIMGYKNRGSIPSTFFSSYVQPFRNDDVLYGKLEKKYKEGFSYLTIKETFDYCEDNIKKYVRMKRDKNEFKDTISELRYVWKIVCNNIENMLRDKKKFEKQKSIVTNLVTSIETLNAVNERIKSVQSVPKEEDSGKVDLSSLFD